MEGDNQSLEPDSKNKVGTVLQATCFIGRVKVNICYNHVIFFFVSFQHLRRWDWSKLFFKKRNCFHSLLHGACLILSNTEYDLSCNCYSLIVNFRLCTICTPTTGFVCNWNLQLKCFRLSLLFPERIHDYINILLQSYKLQSISEPKYEIWRTCFYETTWSST